MLEKTERIRSSILGAIRDFAENEKLDISYDQAVSLTKFIMNSIYSTIKTFTGNVNIHDMRNKK